MLATLDIRPVQDTDGREIIPDIVMIEDSLVQ